MDAWFRKFDTNNDGTVNRDEYLARPRSSEEYWNTVDTNQDGSTALSEATDGRRVAYPLEERVRTFLEQYDGNGDGHIHVGEFRAKREDLARNGQPRPARPDSEL